MLKPVGRFLFVALLFAAGFVILQQSGWSASVAKLSRETLASFSFLKASAVPEIQETMKKAVWSVRFSVFESAVYELDNTHGSPAGIGYVMEMNSNKEVRILKTFPTTFGAIPGMKKAEGDRKTPHGLYYITRIREKADQVNIFGGLFLEINYPNPDDQAQNRTGSGIGIHGGRLLPTRGCIRILDDNWEPGMTNIKSFFDLTGAETPVFIVRKLRPELRAASGSLLSKEAFSLFYEALTTENTSRDAILHLLEGKPADFASGT